MSDQENIQNFNCPACGGTMQYNIEKQQFECSSCGNTATPEVLTHQIKEYDFAQYHARESQSVPFTGMHSVICSSCGAEVIFSPEETANVCPMCGSSQVAPDQQQTGIPPEGIIPFKVDKYQAQELFKKWVTGLWFAPNALKKQYEEDRMQSVYVPFWTFDSNTQGYFNGMGGRTVVWTEHQNGQTVTRTRIDWFPVSGPVGRFFDDILVCASQREGADLIQSVAPFDTIHQLQLYSPAYLSGNKAEHYTIHADEGFENAKSQMYEALKADAVRYIHMMGYDQANVLNLSFNCTNVTYKHVLLPVYTSFFMYSNKKYPYVINGETGKISGQRPYSPIKIALAILAGIIVVFLLVYFFGNDQGSYHSYGMIEYMEQMLDLFNF